MKRWEIDVCWEGGLEIDEDPEGIWVTYEDHLEETQALRESQEELAREVVELRERLEAHRYWFKNEWDPLTSGAE
jgi:hypothetical protein